VCGSPVCKKCRRGGRHHTLCKDHESLRLIHGWAEVVCTTAEIAAELAAEAIRSEGLEVYVLTETGHANVDGLVGIPVVRVLSPAYQYERARTVVEDLDAAESRE